MRHQTLFRQYVWLVNTIARYKKITLEEINERWCETEMSEGIPMARSTFNRHKEAIEEIFGLLIDCDRKDGYKYYISNAEVLKSDTIQNWMLSTMTVNNLLVDNMGLYKRILLESVPSSDKYLSMIMEAMKHNQKVKIAYHKYNQELSPERIVSPFCLKLYHRRWYIIAQIGSGEMRSFSLDRIEQLEILDEHFEIPDDFDADAYFSDVIGIMRNEKYKPERIVIRAFAYEKFYLRDLPIHHSQREISETKEYADFELRLIPSVEFLSHILSRGGYQRVMEPQWLADEIEEAFQFGLEKYQKK